MPADLTQHHRTSMRWGDSACSTSSSSNNSSATAMQSFQRPGAPRVHRPSPPQSTFPLARRCPTILFSLLLCAASLSCLLPPVSADTLPLSISIASDATGPGSPRIPPVPGPRRWRALSQQARHLLEQIQEEMEDYYDERSESWQESARGECHREQQEALQELQSTLEELWV